LSFTIKETSLRQFIVQNLYWKEKSKLAWRFNLEIINKNIDRVGEAINTGKQFHKPALFIQGGNSNHILDEDIEAICTMFPQAEIKTIPDAGHWVHADAPDEFLQCLFNFV